MIALSNHTNTPLRRISVRKVKVQLFTCSIGAQKRTDIKCWWKVNAGFLVVCTLILQYLPFSVVRISIWYSLPRNVCPFYQECHIHLSLTLNNCSLLFHYYLSNFFIEFLLLFNSQLKHQQSYFNYTDIILLPVTPVAYLLISMCRVKTEDIVA